MGTPSRGGWNPCPPGELGRLATRLVGQRRLRHALAITLGAALATGAGLAATVVATRLPGWAYGSSRTTTGCGGAPMLATPGSAPNRTDITVPPQGCQS